MIQNPLTIPVVLFIFNRPDTTEQVFQSIRQVKPKTLFVVGDGPRVNQINDSPRCAQARAVIQQIDWNCEIQTHYSTTNLGIKSQVEKGLGWVFSLVEHAIVLEDDCVPHPDFFYFCEKLLKRYRDESQIMTISGEGGLSFPVSQASYQFSRYPLIWGWATWRRAWERYDPTMSQWPRLRESNWLDELLQDPYATEYWFRIFQINHKTLENWDYAWVLSTWLHNGLSIIPNVNLISNIGFRPDATHTKDALSRSANRPVGALEWPINHPLQILRDSKFDKQIEVEKFSGERIRNLFTILRDRRRRH